MIIIGVYCFARYLNYKTGLNIETSDVIHFIVNHIDLKPTRECERWQEVGINLFRWEVVRYKLEIVDYDVLYLNEPNYFCYKYKKLATQVYWAKVGAVIATIYIVYKDAMNAYTNHDDYIIEWIRRILGLPWGE